MNLINLSDFWFLLINFCTEIIHQDFGGKPNVMFFFIVWIEFNPSEIKEINLYLNGQILIYLYEFWEIEHQK